MGCPDILLQDGDTPAVDGAQRLVFHVACRKTRQQKMDLPLAVARHQEVHGLSLIHISEPTRLLSISYAVFCLKKKK